jgi:hypothetical protein
MSWRELNDYVLMKGVDIPNDPNTPGTYQQIAVLGVLCAHADEHHVTYVSADKIGKILRCDRRSVRNCLEALELYGLIRRTRAEKKKGQRVHWHVLPDHVPVDSCPQNGGDTRQLEQVDGAKVGGVVGGEHGGEHGGDTRHELELEREQKPPREKTAKQLEAANCDKAQGWENKQEKEQALELVIRPAIQDNLKLKPTAQPAGRTLLIAKEQQGLAALDRYLVTYKTRHHYRPTISQLNLDHARLLVAMSLNDEQPRPGDLEKLAPIPDLSA